MKKISSYKKSPLHASALTLNDMFVGRRIIRFNLELGSLGEYIVERSPYVGPVRPWLKGVEHKKRNLLVDLRSTSSLDVFRSGHPNQTFAIDMGLAPYHFYDNRQPYWNDRNFTIDARKAHLLPAPDPSLRRFDLYDYPSYDDYGYNFAVDLEYAEYEE